MSKTATPKMASTPSRALAINESMMEDEGGDFYVDVDSLQSHGVNMADLKKLKAVGICTTRGLRMITKKKLCAIKGLSEAKVEKIKVKNFHFPCFHSFKPWSYFFNPSKF